METNGKFASKCYLSIKPPARPHKSDWTSDGEWELFVVSAPRGGGGSKDQDSGGVVGEGRWR